MAAFSLNRPGLIPPLSILLALFAGIPAPLPAQDSAEAARKAASALTGEQVLKSYLYTYPDKIKEVRLRDGDWTIRVGEQLFYWAEGRLLPPELRDSWRSYQPHSFSYYPREIPPPESFSPAELEAIRVEAREELKDAEDHHRAFQGALFGGITQQEIERSLTRINFLERIITVHSLIAEPLKRVEAAINRASGEDPRVAAFVASIQSIGGYNWREIQGTQRRSYHSWGLAVDILGGAEEGTGTSGADRNKAVYWRWERVRGDNWLTIPADRRWKPPDQVIRAFESEGFIWGGKWPLYDNMHFEFRPEIHEISRMLDLAENGNPRIIRPENTLNLHHIIPLK
jgi:hypothetical protein